MDEPKSDMTMEKPNPYKPYDKTQMENWRINTLDAKLNSMHAATLRILKEIDELRAMLKSD